MASGLRAAGSHGGSAESHGTALTHGWVAQGGREPPGTAGGRTRCDRPTAQGTARYSLIPTGKNTHQDTRSMHTVCSVPACPSETQAVCWGLFCQRCPGATSSQRRGLGSPFPSGTARVSAAFASEQDLLEEWTGKGPQVEEIGRKGTLLENLIVEITAPDSQGKAGESQPCSPAIAGSWHRACFLCSLSLLHKHHFRARIKQKMGLPPPFTNLRGPEVVQVSWGSRAVVRLLHLCISRVLWAHQCQVRQCGLLCCSVTSTEGACACHRPSSRPCLDARLKQRRFRSCRAVCFSLLGPETF